MWLAVVFGSSGPSLISSSGQACTRKATSSRPNVLRRWMTDRSPTWANGHQMSA